MVKLLEEVFGVLKKEGINSIGRLAKCLQEIINPAVLKIIRVTVEQTDQALVDASKARKEDGLRIKERRVPRTVLTDLGELYYERTYFETTEGERCYLTDQLIGVAAYERLTKDLCAMLVQRASEASMDKAAKDVGAPVSRQTVNKKVLALKEVVAEALRVEQTPTVLHLFADEDHVHMKSGRNAIVPLITITEGIDTTSNRHKTINPTHFGGFGVDIQSLFENVSSFLNERYDMEKVERVYMHADGAQWIQGIFEWLPNVTFVMDGFHLEKRLRELGRMKEAAPYMGAIRTAIREDRYELFLSYCSHINEKLDDLGKKRLADCAQFIRNQWDAIVARMAGNICGSCTEPLVSHVLSKRLSRNPLAWSEHGLRQMTMLRIYTINGGVVSAKDIRVSRSEADLDKDKVSFKGGFAKYRAYADKQINEFLLNKPDWTIFENPLVRPCKVDGTYIMRKAFAQMRDSLTCA
jgi:hypothetical protein